MRPHPHTIKELVSHCIPASVVSSDPRSSVFSPSEPDRGRSASKVRSLRTKCFVVLLAVLLSAFLATTTSLSFMFRLDPFCGAGLNPLIRNTSSPTIKGFRVVRPPLTEPASTPTPSKTSRRVARTTAQHNHHCTRCRLRRRRRRRRCCARSRACMRDTQLTA